MKKIFFSLFVLLNLSVYSQQFDILRAIVKHDTVTIIDSNANRNCAVAVTWDYYINGSHIDMYERDTMPGCALCNCLFDFKVSIEDLCGTYDASLYYFYDDEYCGLDTNYIGIIYFNVFTPPTLPVHKSSQYQSDCHTYQSITEKEGRIPLTLYPNPATDEISINYTMPDGINEGEIFIYNLQGLEVMRVKIDAKLNSVMIPISGFASGTYYCQMHTAKENSTVSKIVVMQ